LDYEKIISVGRIDPDKPFSFMMTDNRLRPRLNSPETIKTVVRLINYCNRIGCIPSASDPKY